MLLAAAVIFCADCIRLENDPPVAVSYSSITGGVRFAVEELRKEFGEDSIPSIDSLIVQIDSLSSRFRDGLGDTTILHHMITHIYSNWGICFDPNRNDLFGMLPHTTVLEKKGSCMGVSMLFLMIGEKTGLPLFGVVIPGHFFVRYQSAVQRRNIEPNLKGFEHPDEYYRHHYAIDDSSGYALRNLTVNQSLGIFFFNLANYCSQSGRNELAESFFRRSTSLVPLYAQAWGNAAIHYARNKQPRKARNAFEKALNCNPELVNLRYNYATFELRHKQYRKAIQLYSDEIEAHRVTPELLDGLSRAYKGIGKNDSADIILKTNQKRQ